MSLSVSEHVCVIQVMHEINGNINNCSDTPIWLIIFKLRLFSLALAVFIFPFNCFITLLCHANRYMFSTNSQSAGDHNQFFVPFLSYCWSKTLAFQLLLTKLHPLYSLKRCVFHAYAYFSKEKSLGQLIRHSIVCDIRFNTMYYSAEFVSRKKNWNSN